MLSEIMWYDAFFLSEDDKICSKIVDSSDYYFFESFCKQTLLKHFYSTLQNKWMYLSCLI